MCFYAVGNLSGGRMLSESVVNGCAVLVAVSRFVGSRIFSICLSLATIPN